MNLQQSNLRISTVRRRGAAAVLAMMFMVIFGSLAAAMAIVSQGNLRTADSHLKINRSLAVSETGATFLIQRVAAAARQIERSEGLITGTIAEDVWFDGTSTCLANQLVDALSSELHNVAEPYYGGGTVHIGPISIGPDAPSFTAEIVPHPLAGEDYDHPRYQAEPYTSQNVSNSNPLNATWIRLKVTAGDGPAADRIFRSVSMDLRMAKRIRYAVLSRSRVMIGRNVMVQGPVGSMFEEVNLTNGHPIQVLSDFRGLNADLDSDLDLLVGTLISNDTDGDNRLNTGLSAEIDGLTDPGSFDLSGDGYIDDFDFFLARFDTNNNGEVSAGEMVANSIAGAETSAEQLLELIDNIGNPNRAGFDDGVINADDQYRKVKGSVLVTAGMTDWESGAAGGEYEDYLAGPIVPEYGDDAIEFETDANDAYQFGPDDFDVSYYRGYATNSLAAVGGATDGDVREAVPFGAAYPYDYYDRPLYENRVFEDLYIERGSNALFRNCQFRGVVYIESETENTDINYNYAGMELEDGTPKHPDRFVTIGGTDYYNTKDLGNNIRFHNCDFHGSVVTASPLEFTHVRNKLSFTGTTRWFVDGSPYLDNEEKERYRRSAILAPHYSVEMGSFDAPADPNETITLTGTLVAGLIDMRGQVEVYGTVLTTFSPQSNTGPVLGDTSPQFNTTLGYFSSSAGDLEAELPTGGMGRIKLIYDPELPLPDGINGPIEVLPQWSTYSEGGI